MMLAAVSKSTTRATSEGGERDGQPRQQEVAGRAVSAARTGSGTIASQIAARPAPTATAGAPTKRQSASDQPTTPAVLGSVAGVAATLTTRIAVTT